MSKRRQRNGLCSNGHGLDFDGQPCDLCKPFRIHRATAIDGGCMRCEPDAMGRFSRDGVLCVEVGATEIRLCEEHAQQLIKAIDHDLWRTAKLVTP